MKKLCGIMLTALLVACVAGNGWAGEKAKLGPCVRQCVHAYNPSLADSGADEFMADDFRAKECVQLCKESLYEGECNSWEDDCCHPGFMDTDPDCQTDPPTDPPDTGDGLPPDPGEAGKATIEGIDSDQDGLRDDIQRYIALTYPDSEKTRTALREIAIGLQKALLEKDDENKSMDNAENLMRASECLYYIDFESARKLKNMLKAEYLNTVERSRAYLEYNEKLGGHVFRGKRIDEFNTSCKFNPDIMED